MGHTYHTYDEFGSDLTRPLYGYVGRCKDGWVPKWVKQPSLWGGEAKQLLDIDTDSNGEIPRRKLPSGVTKKSGGRGPTEYTIAREAYLERKRERRREMDEDDTFRPLSANFELNMRGSGAIVSHATGRGPTVPDTIKERLNAIRQTPTGTGRWTAITSTSQSGCWCTTSGREAASRTSTSWPI